MDAQEELAFLRSVAASQLQTIKALTLGCEKYGLTETTPVVRHLAAQDDEIERLRAELVEARKPDCRTCAYCRTMIPECRLLGAVCVGGDHYIISGCVPVRVYERGEVGRFGAREGENDV